MATKKITFDTVRELALLLPRVEDATAYGSPAFKVDGQMFACIAINKQAEPNSLAIRMDFDRRDELIAADPVTYYVKPHYEPYPVVLVRLERVHRDALRDLLQTGWRYVSEKAARRAVKGRPRSARKAPATSARKARPA